MEFTYPLIYMKRIAKLMGGGDFLVILKEENGEKFVLPESVAKQDNPPEPILLGSFLAHSPYWEEL